MDLASGRISDLKQAIHSLGRERRGSTVSFEIILFVIITSTICQDEERQSERQSLAKMVALLEEYVAFLEDPDASSNADKQSYYMSSETVSASEWAEFDHVYQIHCPKIFMDTAIRDVRPLPETYYVRRCSVIYIQIILQYYHCSRARRGLEYHMASR